MQVSKVDREKLLLLENPRYAEVIAKYNHLRGVEMLDKDLKPELAVHLVIGTNEYTQIKTKSTPRIGRPGEPIAEKTKFGWTIMSPGKEVNVNEMFLTQTSSADYESLCRLHVLEYKIARPVTKARSTKNSRKNCDGVQTVGTRLAFHGKEIIYLFPTTNLAA